MLPKKGVQVSIVMKDGWLYADKDMMEIVLRNLVSKAIKLPPGDGLVCISGRLEKIPTCSSTSQGIGPWSHLVEKILGREF